MDAGGPATAHGLDLDGNPLVADGNADGFARRDLGAFELQPVPTPSSAPAADTLAPLVSGFKATPARFAVGHGTHFRYTLSENARITITLKRVLTGRRVAAGKCVKPSKRLAHAKRCTRYRTAAHLYTDGQGGANSTPFTGRIGKKALRPGRYRALIAATDPAGNRSLRKSRRFRIVRRTH